VYSLAGPFLVPFWANKKEQLKRFEVFKKKKGSLNILIAQHARSQQTTHHEAHFLELQYGF
jgi:hypothetical protein